MSQYLKLSVRVCTLSLVALFASTSAIADKPSWVEEGKKNKHEGKHDKKHEDRQQERQPERQMDTRQESRQSYFDDSNRRMVQEYYGEKIRRGKCPPGLAKKNNGCMPPGQAKKWAVGQPLPADVKPYELPRDLAAKLPPPPSGHRYVRVASDILMIAVGTSMVQDALEDIIKR